MRTETDPRTDDAARLDAVRVYTVLFVSSGLLVFAVGVLTWRWPVAGYDPLPLVVFGGSTVALSAVFYRMRHRVTWWFMHAFSIFAIVLACVASILFSGAPSFAPVGLLWIILFAFGFFPRRIAIVCTALALASMAVQFAVQPGWPNPGAFGLFLGGSLVVTAWFVRQLVARAERSAAAEREARLELDALNRTLEARVDEQVDELARLDRLRRFLSPSIADAVVSTDAEVRLAPHRAQIAAFFCDLRGFTAFSAEAEPEDVSTLLQRFHSAIGPLVDRYEATVGGFAGDGVALYFNDPIPCPDPAVRAVKLALDLKEPMAELTIEWRRLGFEVGYGVGIALGYATLGITGFEHRQEYTAIGTVMNLASRLSDEARTSEVLLDQRAASAVDEQFRTEPVDDLTLKGFARPVQAYRVVPAS